MVEDSRTPGELVARKDMRETGGGEHYVLIRYTMREIKRATSRSMSSFWVTGLTKGTINHVRNRAKGGGLFHLFHSDTYQK